MIMTAETAAEALVPWIEPNTDALSWEPLEEAVLRALSGPGPEEYAENVPLLRYANINRPSRPLVAALTDPRIPRRKGVCDITGTPMREPNTLWVPCGDRSVVQVTMRNHTRGLLADYVGTDLVWC